MTSPFPGMDPYLERSWGDVHARLVTYACDYIQPQLPRDLRARMQERLVVRLPEEGERSVVPDVRVVARPHVGPGGGAAVAEIADVAEPLVLFLDEKEIEAFIQIVEAGSVDRVITVIEVLSPANKRRGRDMDKYVRKREELAAARISLVEIDLLREGTRELGDLSLRVPAPDRTAYQVCAHRGWRPIAYEIYRAPLRERLPKIRIPLRERDADVVLDLQAIVDQAYHNGRYDQTDYAVEPDPPLDPEDAAWADALLRAKGVR